MKKGILLVVAFLMSLVFLVVSIGSVIEISVACRRPPSGFDGAACVPAELWASCLTAALSAVASVGVVLAFRRQRFRGILLVGLGGLGFLYAAEALSQVLAGHALGAKAPAMLAVMWVLLALLSLATQRNDR